MMRFLKLFTAVLAFLVLCGCGASDTPQVTDIDGDGKLTCTLEIRCDTLLGNLDQLSAAKAKLVPEDGILLEAIQVEFQPGETVFDVFRRVLRERKIHFEYVDATLYSSAYVEGIGNLYEFDCGPQSGWKYSVNGIFQGLGCSSYTLADGDTILFAYTCDFGADLGQEITYE